MMQYSQGQVKIIVLSMLDRLGLIYEFVLFLFLLSVSDLE